MFLHRVKYITRFFQIFHVCTFITWFYMIFTHLACSLHVYYMIFTCITWQVHVIPMQMAWNLILGLVFLLYKANLLNVDEKMLWQELNLEGSIWFSIPLHHPMASIKLATSKWFLMCCMGWTRVFCLLQCMYPWHCQRTLRFIHNHKAKLTALFGTATCSWICWLCHLCWPAASGHHEDISQQPAAASSQR